MNKTRQGLLNILSNILYMIKYKPYKSDKPEKKYYIITESGKRYILGLLVIVTLHNTKTKQENNDI